MSQVGFLKIYPYESWEVFPHPFSIFGWESFPIKSLSSEARKTKPKALLSEADLISLMDKHGIGTDATIHSHIKTV